MYVSFISLLLYNQFGLLYNEYSAIRFPVVPPGIS